LLSFSDTVFWVFAQDGLKPSSPDLHHAGGLQARALHLALKSRTSECRIIIVIKILKRQENSN
jgi:hypothetical protein